METPWTRTSVDDIIYKHGLTCGLDRRPACDLDEGRISAAIARLSEESE